MFILCIFTFYIFIYFPHQWISIHPLVLFLYIIVLWKYVFWIPMESKWFRFHPWIRKITIDHIQCTASDPNETLKDQKRPTLFLYHPHGVYAACMFAFFCFNEECQHIRAAVSSILFRTPIIREVVGLLGCIHVNKKDIVNVLKKNESVVVCPGGLRELLVWKDSAHIYYKRESTIALAIEIGVDIVLVECPDEVLLYWLWIPNIMYPVQNFLLQKCLYPFFIFSWGYKWAPFWPKKLTPGPVLYFSKRYNTFGKTVEELMNEIYGHVP